MSSERDRLAAEALKLPAEERERLVKTIVDSLSQPDAAETGTFGGFASAEIQRLALDEAERRLQRFRDGKSTPMPVEDAFASIRARLKASCANR